MWALSGACVVICSVREGHLFWKPEVRLRCAWQGWDLLRWCFWYTLVRSDAVADSPKPNRRQTYLLFVSLPLNTGKSTTRKGDVCNFHFLCESYVWNFKNSRASLFSELSVITQMKGKRQRVSWVLTMCWSLWWALYRIISFTLHGSAAGVAMVNHRTALQMRGGAPDVAVWVQPAQV